MKIRIHRKNRGYIALISTIVISLILLALTANMSTAGFYVRFNSLDSEYKRVSLGYAESCIHAALLKLAKNNTYAPPSGGETVSVGSEACTIIEVLTDLSDPTKKTIKTKASFRGAFSNMEIVTIIQDPLVAPRIPAYIFVVVQVVNDNGGMSSAGDFTVNLTAVNPSASSFPGAETGTLITADAGPYSVSETGPAGYLTTYSADCSSTIAEGETKTCTITNNDVPTTATLTVIANVINNNSGSLGPGAFPLFIDGIAVSNGVGVTVSPGSHTVTGTGAGGYSASPWGNHCASDGTITLAVGESKTCIITYDDPAPPAPACADTVMMLDRTGSMSSTDLVNERIAAKGLLDLYAPLSPAPKVGVGVFGNPADTTNWSAIIVGNLTDVYSGLYTAIDTWLATSNGGTNLSSAISVGHNELISNGSPTAANVLILLSDGDTNRPTTNPIEAALDAADVAKSAGTKIFTIFFGTDPDGTGFSGQGLLAALANGSVPVGTGHPGHSGALHELGSANDRFLNGDSGFLSPSASSNSGWSNPNYAFVSDNNRAVANSDSDIVRYYNFNFSIPTGSVINGIEVQVEGYTANSRQAQISLSWNGSSYTFGSGIKTTNMPGTTAVAEDIRTFGGSTDTWNRTWIPGDFTNANFRVRLDANSSSGDLNIDHVRVKVYYTYPDAVAENADGDYFFISPTAADMPALFETIGTIVCPAAALPPPPPPPTTGTLQVITTVINDNGGTKVANDFTMIITAVNPSINSFPVVATPGRAVTVEPGSYSVDEGPTGPYVKTFAGCSGTIAAGETKTCTITNDDTPPPSNPPPPPPPPPNITIESWVEQPSGP